MEETLEIYEDLSVAVIYRKEESSINFSVHDIVYFDDGEPVFEGIGGCGADEKSTKDVNIANAYIKGIIKWDGCSHVYFGDNEGYIHLCGSSDFTRIGKLLNTVYKKCCDIGGFYYDLMKE